MHGPPRISGLACIALTLASAGAPKDEVVAKWDLPLSDGGVMMGSGGVMMGGGGVMMGSGGAPMMPTPDAGPTMPSPMVCDVPSWFVTWSVVSIDCRFKKDQNFTNAFPQSQGTGGAGAPSEGETPMACELLGVPFEPDPNDMDYFVLCRATCDWLRAKVRDASEMQAKCIDAGGIAPGSSSPAPSPSP